jgi:hypothetical protein
MIVSTAPYFAPTFFSPYYFPPLAVGGVGPGPAAPFRDGDGFTWIVQALRATGEFSDVLFGVTADRRAVGAGRSPIAVVAPEGWAESDDWDPVLLARQVSFTVTLIARDEEPSVRYGVLDRLSCVAQDAVGGSDLGGMALAPLTRLARGRFDATSRHPEQAVVLSGEFTYLIPSWSGHDLD